MYTLHSICIDKPDLADIKVHFIRQKAPRGLGDAVLKFNYRFADAKNACIFVGVRLSRGLEERKEILQMLNDGGYSVVDL